MSGFSQILLTFLVGFAGNMIWEMAQMHAYFTFPGSGWKMLLSCGAAALGDAIYITALFVLGRKFTHEQDWTSRLRWRWLSVVAGTSVITAVVIEAVSQRLGAWRYAETMPVIPVLGLGLWPVLQLPLLTIAVFAIVGRIECESS